MSTSLSRPFEAARLRLELPDRPLVALNPDIFQMDIQRPRIGETFRLWQGHPSNSVRVTDSDRKIRQLVLLVQEPSRSFEVTVRKSRRANAPDQVRGLSFVKETATAWIFRRWTDPTMRRYLCGMDESHLFIAEFAGGTTVRDAHRLLKPDAVREADRSAPGRTLRQGEWFFVSPSAAELRLLEHRIAETPHIVRRFTSLGGNGRPHVADQVVRISEVYARGRIRHPDHKTLLLPGWRRVHRNAEVHGAAMGSNGVFWID
jgi:hypothetical protein